MLLEQSIKHQATLGIELLSFRHTSVLAGDMNAKHPFWNSAVSNPSGVKLLNLLHINEFEILASRSPTSEKR
jgi:hypothetical protein